MGGHLNQLVVLIFIAAIDRHLCTLFTNTMERLSILIMVGIAKLR